MLRRGVLSPSDAVRLSLRPILPTAGEVDMLPAEGREEGQYGVRNHLTFYAHGVDHFGDLDGVPEYNGGSDEG